VAAWALEKPSQAGMCGSVVFQICCHRSNAHQLRAVLWHSTVLDLVPASRSLSSRPLSRAACELGELQFKPSYLKGLETRQAELARSSWLFIGSFGWASNSSFGNLQPASAEEVAGWSAVVGRSEVSERSTPLSSSPPLSSAEGDEVATGELQPFSCSLTCHFKQMQIKPLHRVGSFPSFM